MINVHMTALFTNRLYFQFDFAVSLCINALLSNDQILNQIFKQYVLLASNHFVKLWHHIKHKKKGLFTKRANIFVLFKVMEKWWGACWLMYKEYAYTKLRHLRWAVTLNGQSLVYVNVIQNGHLEHELNCVSTAIVAG